MCTDMGGQIFLLTEQEAQAISAWHYPGEYALYNFSPEDSLDELLDGSSWGVRDAQGALTGFYQFGRGGRIPTKEQGAYLEGPLDIGLGLRPDLCGKGLGESFLLAGMEFARARLGAEAFRLTVAAWNLRARKVYARCGFGGEKQVTHRVSGDRFLILTNPIRNQ